MVGDYLCATAREYATVANTDLSVGIGRRISRIVGLQRTSRARVCCILKCVGDPTPIPALVARLGAMSFSSRDCECFMIFTPRPSFSPELYSFRPPPESDTHRTHTHSLSSLALFSSRACVSLSLPPGAYARTKPLDQPIRRRQHALAPCAAEAVRHLQIACGAHTVPTASTAQHRPLSACSPLSP